MNEKTLRYTLIKKWIPILFVLLTFPSIMQWLNVEIGSTTFWWTVESFFLLFTYIYSIYYFSVEHFYWRRTQKKLLLFSIYELKKKNYKLFFFLITLFKKNIVNKVEKLNIPLPIVLYIIYIIISIIHSCDKANYYWDWKNMFGNLMFYLIPVITIFFSNPTNFKRVCQKWISFAIIMFFPLLPLMQMECPGRFLAPFAFFIVFWSYYNKKGKILCAIALFSVFAFGSLGARSSILRFFASFIFSLFIIIKDKISKKILLFFSIFLLIIPIVFFILGVTGEFNIFKFGDYIDVDITVANSFEDGKTENLSVDTRTFLYVETLNSAIEHDYWLFGNSLSQGYYATMFAELDEVEGRGMRYSTEVCILNVFTNLGLIGVLLFFSVFVYTIINVFLHSNNKTLCILSLLLSFRWMFSFLEEFTRFDLNTIFLWIEFAICNSCYFLRMTDDQIKKWFRDLLIQ